MDEAFEHGPDRIAKGHEDNWGFEAEHILQEVLAKLAVQQVEA